MQVADDTAFKDLKFFELKTLDDVTPETQVLVFSDHQAGEITPTYNKEIYKQRVSTIVDKALLIKHLHEKMYPIEKLEIFLVGDMVHGENPRQGAKVEGIEEGAKSQIFDLCLPTLKQNILRLKNEYQSIRISGVRGNHGKYDRNAPDTTNWDSILYASLQESLSSVQGVSIEYSNNFYQMVDVEDWRFFLFHGNQVMTYQGIPFYGIIRKVMSWYVTLGGFQYAVCGHWHVSHNISVSAQTELFMNGALPSDDPFALEMVGSSSAPKQWTFGVHPKIGVTWRYPLYADNSFLPRRIC